MLNKRQTTCNLHNNDTREKYGDCDIVLFNVSLSDSSKRWNFVKSVAGDS